MDVDELLDEMNKRYWDTLGSDNIIQRFSDEIQNHDPLTYLIRLVGNDYHHTFVFSNFLYNTNLWSTLNLHDWLTLIERVERPRDTKFIIDNYGGYVDIIFLYKFLKIDSLDLVCKSGMGATKQLAILNALAKLYKVVFLDETDLESFRDDTYPDGETYEKVHACLIDQGAVKAEDVGEKIQNAIFRYVDLTISSK